MKRKSATILISALALIASATTVAWAAGKDPDPPAGSRDRRVGAASAPVYQPASELRYVPVGTCTIANTSKSGGRLSTTVRTLIVGGSSGFTAQGGSSTGCGVPQTAVSVQVNFVVTKPKKAGTLVVGPAGQAPDLVTVAFAKGKTATGSVNVSLSGTSASMVVKASAGKPYLTATVSGYYVKPLAGFISPSGNPYSGSSRILGGTKTSTGVYEVQFDRNIRYCAATATAYVSAYYASATTWFDSARPDTVRVNVWDAAGAATDQYFYIAVSC